MNISFAKSDSIGAIASTMCVVHCLMTPLFFAVQKITVVQHNNVPLLWINLDFLFITISVIAVYHSAKKSSSYLMKYLLWVSWVTLFVLILNEKTEWISLKEIITYFAAIVLAFLHIYNLKFCKCETENCCQVN
jgi:hypothetical protein